MVDMTRAIQWKIGRGLGIEAVCRACPIAGGAQKAEKTLIGQLSISFDNL